MKKAFLLLVLVCSSLYLPLCMKQLTHGFRIEKMRLKSSCYSDWEVPPLSKDAHRRLMKLLDQPFYYLGRGAQCYVFESADQLYVIKLFRFDQRQNPIRTYFRTKIRKQPAMMGSEEKISHLFSACKLAYTIASEETELFYLHLNLTENQLPFLLLKGPLGRSLSLPLDSYCFALQKKAEPLNKALLAALHADQMQLYLDSLLSLLLNRTSKGISNSDGNLFRNFGFVGQRAIEMDFGNYGYSPDLLLPSHRKQEIGRFTSSLRAWLEIHAPEWVAYLDQKMEQI